MFSFALPRKKLQSPMVSCTSSFWGLISLRHHLAYFIQSLGMMPMLISSSSQLGFPTSVKYRTSSHPICHGIMIHANSSLHHGMSSKVGLSMQIMFHLAYGKVMYLSILWSLLHAGMTVIVRSCLLIKKSRHSSTFFQILMGLTFSHLLGTQSSSSMTRTPYLMLRAASN